VKVHAAGEPLLATSMERRARQEEREQLKAEAEETIAKARADAAVVFMATGDVEDRHLGARMDSQTPAT
jgi:hypothetical protein